MQAVELGEKLGEGAYGKVFAVKGRGDATVKISEPASDLDEVSVLRALAGLPNILQFEQYFISGDSVWIVMPRYDMSLERYLGYFGSSMRDSQRTHVMREITQGLNAMHENGFVHLDVKPSNILVSSSLDKVVVADFGISKPQASGSIYPDECYSLFYRPPELLMSYSPIKTNLSPRMDVWALGCVFYEILASVVLFGACTDEVHMVFAVVQLWKCLNTSFTTEEYWAKFGWARSRRDIPDLDGISMERVNQVRKMYWSTNRPAVRARCRSEAFQAATQITTHKHRDLVISMLEPHERRIELSGVLEYLHNI